MKKQTKKLAITLLTVGCASLCVGGSFVAKEFTAPNAIVASAETTYTINKFDGGTGSSTSSVVYAYCDTKTWNGHESWPAFTFVEGSGSGFTWNGGDAFTPTAFKWAGQDFYIELGKTATAGDYFVLDGKFYVGDEYVVFSNCALKYNGSAWETFTATATNYTTYNLGALLLHGNSNVGAAKDLCNQLHLRRADEGTIPNFGWENEFKLASGTGVKVNGKPIEYKVKSPDGDLLFIEFAALNTGDVLTVGGTFVYDAQAVKYVVEDSHFKWTGTGWEVYTPPVEDKTYNIGTLDYHVNSSTGAARDLNDALYLKRVDGEALPVLDWDVRFAHESGDGLKINGQAADLLEMKSTPDGLYLKFDPLNAGDVVSISGTFVCEAKSVKYIIEESFFQWTGSAWIAYIAYEEYTLGAPVSIEDNYIAFAEGVELPVDSWDHAFQHFSGNGITVNGTMINMENNVKSVGDKLYANFGEVKEGDKLVIGGALCNEALVVKYIITETTFVYDGTAWLSALDLLKNENKVALDEYKATFAEADYYEAEWASLATLVENGKASIDAATTIEEANAALNAAKAALDEVLTKAEAGAIVDESKTNAKAELAAYKNASDYRDAEVAAMQEILAQANALIDVCESPAQIAEVVTAAKADLDALKTSAVWEAEEEAAAAAALAEAKTAAKNEVKTYYNALNFALYTDEAKATLSGYVATANSAIESATTVDEVNQALTAFKANVDGVEKIKAASESGCGSLVGSGLAAGLAVAAAVGAVLLRKKKED